MNEEIAKEILSLLAFEWRGRRQADIVEELKRPKTTVREVLLRLEERGKLERADNGLWYLAETTPQVVRMEPAPECEVEEEQPEEVVAEPPQWHRELLDNVTFLPSAELDLGPAPEPEPEPEPAPGNRVEEDGPEAWRWPPAPEVEIRVLVPTWVARRVFRVLEEAAREAKAPL